MPVRRERCGWVASLPRLSCRVPGVTGPLLPAAPGAPAATRRAPETAGEVCRLTVLGSGRRVDLAVPDQILLIEVLPVLLRHLGAGGGAEHDGWVVQRLGEPPLDERRNLADLGLHDGDIVYLRPRTQPTRPVVFDDLVDGVATGIANRRDRWRPVYTRWVYVCLAAVAPVIGLSVLLHGGAAGPRAAVAVGVAVALLLAAAVAGRGLRELATAWCWGYLAAAYAALAGWLAPQALGAGSSGAAALVAGGAAAACAVMFAVLAAGGTALVLLPAAVVAGAVLVAGLVQLLQAPVAGAAAVVLLLAQMLDLVLPRAAARFARLRMPPPPSTVAELLADIDPLAADDVLARAALADRYLTAGHAGLAPVLAGCLALLAFEPGWAPPTICGVTATVLLLHARTFVSAAQRLLVVAPAVLGLVLCAVRFFAGLPAPARLVVGVCAPLIGSALLFAGARTLPGQQVQPMWGRVADIAEAVLGAALIPLALVPLGVFTAVRALGG